MPTLAVIEPTLGASGKRSAETIRDMLTLAGFDTMVLGEDSAMRSDSSVPFRRLRYRFIMYEVFSALRVIRMRKEIDTAFFHIGAPSLFAVIVVCRALGIRTVVLVTGSESESARQIMRKEKGKIAGALGFCYYLIREWLSFSMASRLIVYEPSLIGYFKMRRWAEKARTAGPLPVDTAIFNQNTAYANRPDLIGFVGRLSEEKGASILVRSLPYLFASRPSTRAIIVGDGPLRLELNEFVRNSGIQEHVEFTGWVNTQRVSTLLNMMKLCVIPSTSEAVPTIMLQALACGTPVLASDMGGMHDTLNRGDLGFLFDVYEPAQLAEKIRTILDGADLAEMSARIALYSKAEFGMEMVAQRYRLAIADDRADILHHKLVTTGK